MNKIYQLTITDCENITLPGTKGQRLKISYEYLPKSFIGTPEESSKKQTNFIDAFGTETDQHIWGLTTEDYIKVIFEYGKNEIIRKIKEQNFSENELNIKIPVSSQDKNPYTPSKINMIMPWDVMSMGFMTYMILFFQYSGFLLSCIIAIITISLSVI